eukprot:TRINITY_DN5607_c0_g1_i2.p2 TRINITY_DN5607_c0_g1~~TRINITY_DN5607_c0_g1_i2.p2  ORF type:complete len:399 (+),score=50.24 TRINITY_DN5607_c0_g1_i2:25-1221(+)
METGYQVKYINENRGRGLFATRNYKEGEIILKETPLIAMQQVENRTAARTCGWCFSFLGTLEEQLIGHMTLIQGGNPNVQSMKSTTSCGFGCGELYCSEQCRTSAWERHHNMLCVGQIDLASHALVRFKQHAIENHELFLLAAQAIAVMMYHWRTNGHDIGAAVKVFTHFTYKPWWEVVKSEAWPKQVLVEMVSDSLLLLKEGLLKVLPEEEAPVLQPLLNLDFYSNLLGLLERNDNGIEIGAPLQRHYESLLDDPNRQQKQEWPILESVANEIIKLQDADPECEDSQDQMDHDDHDDHDGHDGHDDHDPHEKRLVFPPFEGLGIFPMSAMSNHSCDPNTLVKFGQNFVAEMVALRNIMEGEELHHSYIENEDVLEERQAQLLEYDFVCDCPKCQAGL